MSHERGATRRFAGLAAAASLLAACSSGASPSPTSSLSSPTAATTPTSPSTTPLSSSQPSVKPTPSPSTVLSSQIRAAEAAYARFNAAYIVSEMKPRKLGQPWPRGGDFTKFSFVPFSTDSTNDIIFLSHYGLEYRGAPPQSRVVVLTTALTTKPPEVVLSDCPTAPASWQTYNVSNGKIAPNVKPKIPPPYRSRVVMVYKQSHWGVLSARDDTTKTCHA